MPNEVIRYLNGDAAEDDAVDDRSLVAVRDEGE